MMRNLLLSSFCLLLLLSLCFCIPEDPRNEFLSYATVKPIVTKLQTGSHPHLLKVSSEENLVLEFEAFNKTFAVDLKINKDLFSPNYVETYQLDGEELVYQPVHKKERRCYYKGNIPNAKNSWAAISTCRGIRGVVFDGEESYYIEPDSQSLNDEHFVFKESDRIVGNFMCGNDFLDANDIFVQKSKFETHDKFDEAIARESKYSTKYIELIIINDNLMYKKYESNLTAVNDRAKEVANIASALYSPLDIVISVLKVKTWSDKDLITISGDYIQTLKNFLQYKEKTLLPSEPHDNALLLTNTRFRVRRGFVTGAAYPSGMCTDARSGVEIVDYSSVAGAVAATFAHELGHNFGMAHDDQLGNCKCPEKFCIMFSQAQSKPKTEWSSCSKETLEKKFEEDKFKCLENKPEELN